jgi:hypothetical protein
LVQLPASLSPLAGTIIQRDTLAGKDVGEGTRSREAIRVYLTGGKAYKVFGAQAACTEEYDQTKAVKDAGVPVAGNIKTYTAKLTGSNAAGTEAYNNDDVWVLESDLLTGTFFQFSKPGHTRLITTAIAEQRDIGQVRKIKSGLEAAQDAHLTDPQGFLSTLSTPIKFIDIHTGAHAHASLADLIAQADARIAALKPAPAVAVPAAV